jgi:hypothetical protein
MVEIEEIVSQFCRRDVKPDGELRPYGLERKAVCLGEHLAE